MATLRQRLMMRLVNLYPPYLGAGVRVSYPKDDDYRITVRMGLHFWNKNLFGTQFGGSLYSMCDPHFVFIRHQASRPGLRGVEQVGRDRVLEAGPRARDGYLPRPAGEDRGDPRGRRPRREIEPVLVAEVVADDGDLVARVTETLWVRKKEPPRT